MEGAMPDVFISYSRKDIDAARALTSALETAGLSVWYDTKLSACDNFGEAIERQIRNAKAVIVIWSEASVKSEWVCEEASYAREQGKLLPITTVAPFDLPLGFAHINTINLQNETDLISVEARSRIVEAVEKMIKESKSER
jgi:hypothetical protein